MAMTFKILFVTPNEAARANIAAAILNKMGHGRFQGYAASASGNATIHPFTREILEREGIASGNLHIGLAAAYLECSDPEIEFVFLLHDAEHGESGPTWEGTQLVAQWNIPDPLGQPGQDIDRRRAFASVFKQIERRLALLVNLPIEKLDALTLQNHLDKIGQRTTEERSASTHA